MNSPDNNFGTSVSGQNDTAVLFDNFLNITKFNAVTGEYRIIKSYHDDVKNGDENSETLHSYFRRSLEAGIIHPDDRELITRFMEPEYLSERLFGEKGGRRIILQGIRYNIFGVYRSVTMEIFAPKNLSLGDPWTVFCIRADRQISPDSSAVSRISSNYYKIIYINLESGAYEPVFMMESEIGSENSFIPVIWDWMRQFALNGNILDEDMEGFLLYTDPEYIRMWLRENEGKYFYSYRYRRKVCGEYRPVVIKMIRSLSYSENEPNVYGFICIDDPVKENSTERRAIEKYFCRCDVMTGMWNQSRYTHLCRRYSESSVKNTVEVLYARLGGELSDENSIGLITERMTRAFAFFMTDTFGKDKCYRIGENEFAVIFVGGDGGTFSRRADRFCSQVMQNGGGLVSLAYISEKGSDTVEEVLDKARSRAFSGNDVLMV